MPVPTYSDGKFHLYQIENTDDVYSQETLIDTEMDIWFNELSISDVNKSVLMQNGIKTTGKIRIPQYKKINSMSVVEIDGKYYRVYNAYHFDNKDGFPETDLTLERYHYDKA